MDAIEKALKKELKHLPISIPALIFCSEKPERVKRLIQIYEKRGNEKEMKFWSGWNGSWCIGISITVCRNTAGMRMDTC